jgi:hypothetical protein
MKARVKATNEVVDVMPERDGFFVDDENNNVYKFDELDFTYKDENQSQDPFASMLSGFLNPTKDLQKGFKEQFYANKFIEVFLDFFKMFYGNCDTLKDAFDDSLEYTKKLMEELKK